MCSVLAGRAYLSTRSASLSPEVFLEQAHEDLKLGRFSRVEAALDRIGRSGAPTPQAALVRAQLALARNHPDLALASLAEVPDDSYMAGRAHLLAGQIERQRDCLRLAEEEFRKAIRLEPELVQAHRELIYIHGMQLRRPELHGDFLALQALTNLKFDTVLYWCSLRNNSWEPGVVVGDLMRFVAADPHDRWSRLALAENFRRMGRKELADGILACLPPNDLDANAIRIQIALDRQDTELADKLLAIGSVDHPALARLHGCRALAHRDARSAVRYFRIAYAADPDDHDTLFGLRTALILLGNANEARTFCQAAGNLDRLNTLLQRANAGEAQKNPELVRELGAVCAALHRDAEARAWLQLAITRNPLDSEAQEALFRLNAGGAR